MPGQKLIWLFLPKRKSNMGFQEEVRDPGNRIEGIARLVLR